MHAVLGRAAGFVVHAGRRALENSADRNTVGAQAIAGRRRPRLGTFRRPAMARNRAVGLIAKEVGDPLRRGVTLARAVTNCPVAWKLVAAKLSKITDEGLGRERTQDTARVASVDDGAPAAVRTRLPIGRRTATSRCCARFAGGAPRGDGDRVPVAKDRAGAAPTAIGRRTAAVFVAVHETTMAVGAARMDDGTGIARGRYRSRRAGAIRRVTTGKVSISRIGEGYAAPVLPRNLVATYRLPLPYAGGWRPRFASARSTRDGGPRNAHQNDHTAQRPHVRILERCWCFVSVEVGDGPRYLSTIYFYS